MSPQATPLLDPIRRKLLHIFILLATSDKPVTGKVMAEELAVSLSSIEIYLKIARDNEHIKGVRGVTGGYTLDCHPKDITVLDIIGKTIKILQINCLN